MDNNLPRCLGYYMFHKMLANCARFQFHAVYQPIMLAEIIDIWSEMKPVDAIG